MIRTFDASVTRTAITCYAAGEDLTDMTLRRNSNSTYQTICDMCLGEKKKLQHENIANWFLQTSAAANTISPAQKHFKFLSFFVVHFEISYG
jgi:hypothetical protein